MEENQFLKRLGAHLKKKRIEKKLSLLKFAQLLEIEKPNLARIERGGNNLTIMNLKKMADALEVPLKDLLDFS